MTKRKWKYCGLIVFIVLITASAWLWYSHSRQEVRLSGEAAERKELEESLRAKDKQIDFYFRKVNELIHELNQNKLEDNPIKGEKDLYMEDQLVWDVLESEEYKAVLEEYIKHYGIIDEYIIPKTETLGGFRYKVEESIAEGYDLLPKYYGWTEALMNMATKEFRDLNTLYKEHFGEGIPTEVIYGTMEELIDIVNRSVKEGRDLLPEYYRY
ncbi:hypothetical protein NSS79_14930 [Paenibacillus sp. FSL L8-0436]|uniref:hypothetical protein n=1 Tax=unclassified Paenibacillus TaxID=185978 RepID=UPI0004F6C9B3|nr:hypothetical protein [Paenibacillus sp. FSL H7-0357]AIQ18021.1 hypothetical protein H70357_16065 [Paenibacillus sp. FSL H7-0357]